MNFGIILHVDSPPPNDTHAYHKKTPAGNRCQQEVVLLSIIAFTLHVRTVIILSRYMYFAYTTPKKEEA